MVIRLANVFDAAEIRKLVSSLSHYYLDGIDRDSRLPNWFAESITVSAFEQRLSSDEFISYVYVIESEIIAYISLKDQSHLYHLFVAEDFQRQGLAKKLWVYLMSQNESKIYTVRSSVYAIPTYKRFGFKELGPLATKDGIAFQSMELVI